MKASCGTALAAGFVFFSLPTTSASDATDLEDQVAALEKIVAQDQKLAPDDLKLQQAMSRVASLENALARKNYNNAFMVASALAVKDRSDAMLKALAPIQAELARLREAQEIEVAGRFKQVLDDATDAVKTKTAPADFDPVLSEIANAINVNISGSDGSFHPADNQRLQAASHFVSLWQHYLIDKAAGNLEGATNELRELSAGNDTFMPIPRSQLLEMELKLSGQGGNPAAPLATDIVLHSFDDLPAAIGQLEALPRVGNSNPEMYGLLNALQGLHTAYLSYLQKNYSAAIQQLTMNQFFSVGSFGVGPSGVAVAGNSPDALLRQVAVLKNQLLIEIAQALLNLPDLPAPAAGETAPDYLLSAAADREKAADWPALQQVLLVYQQISVPMMPVAWLQEDLAGLHTSLVGEKLEDAGQTLDAIRSYRQALATIGKYFPAAPPSAKLNELAKKYPALYQQALQEPITSPRGP
jgi:tetratricopeptide (TPR) repeat protein